MLEEDQAMNIGNMRKKFGKDHVWLKRYARRQTDRHRHTQACLLQYLATTAVGEVIITQNTIFLIVKYFELQKY